MAMSWGDDIMIIYAHFLYIRANKPKDSETGVTLLCWSYLKYNGQFQIL